MAVTVTLIGKPDCHLCEVARAVIDEVIQDASPGDIVVREVSIQQDAQLYQLWWEKIPVVLINDRFHAHWRLSADRLRVALEQAGGLK